jgi:hypothetical protein
MSPDNKKTAVAIVQRFAGDNAWSTECFCELMNKVGVKLANLTMSQPCIFLANKDPTYLDRGFEDIFDKIVTYPAITAAESNRKQASAGLIIFGIQAQGNVSLRTL